MLKRKLNAGAATLLLSVSCGLSGCGRTVTIELGGSAEPNITEPVLTTAQSDTDPDDAPAEQQTKKLENSSAETVTVTEKEPTPREQNTQAGGSSNDKAGRGSPSVPGAAPGEIYYRGTITQHSEHAHLNKSYPVTINLDTWKVTYDTVGCVGHLTKVDGESVQYREEITSGNCDQDGIWELNDLSTPFAKSMYVKYSPPSGRYWSDGTVSLGPL